MGLAASQARFLGITMRKAQCEFRSTELAQQKLEITNQLAQIAQDYSNGMNATRLVWSNEDIGADVNLAYSLLMMPSVANDYNPYMTTTPSGAIVLNDAFAAAAKAAGISMAGGSASADGRDKFIAALVAEGLLSPETAGNIQVTDYIYADHYDQVNNVWVDPAAVTSNTRSVAWNGLAGLGAAPKDKTVASTMTLSDMLVSDQFGDRVINMLAADSEHNYMSQGAYNQIRDEELRNKYETIANIGGIFNTANSSKLLGGGLLNMILNGTISTDSSMIQNMTLRDLMSNEVVLMSEDKGGQSLSNFAEKIRLIFESIAGIFGFNQPKGTGLYVDDASFEALQRAVAMTEAHFLKPGNAINVGENTSDKDITQNSAYQNAISNNRIGSDNKSGSGWYAVSLNNMISTFLTYFDNELRGSESPFFAGRSLENEETYMVTECASYQYIVGKPDTDVVTNDVKIADFYDELYNNLCAKGWRNDSAIDDPDYFQNTIKNGKYQLMSLNMDGYFYQTRYNDTGYLVEEVDKDAVARAEAEYTRKKSELTYKEDYIDLKNKNVDAEIAELNTEMESVKNMISKSVEKTFTMFSQ
ncbi:hypothetical protein IJ596_05920 [bacterium]|nr:hypothetical protein [bacterium]